MRTPLEITIQLDELLKKSKPFRNSNEVFSLTAELLSTLSPSEAVIEESIIETIINNPIEFTEPTEEDIKSFNESVTSFLEIEPIEEPVVETEQIILMKNEEGIFKEITVNEETTTVEEILEPVVAKRGAKKK
jgi:argonaute-like protein implicated in RNA metabolism and viral defense